VFCRLPVIFPFWSVSTPWHYILQVVPNFFFLVFFCWFFFFFFCVGFFFFFFFFFLYFFFFFFKKLCVFRRHFDAYPFHCLAPAHPSFRKSFRCFLPTLLLLFRVPMLQGARRIVSPSVVLCSYDFAFAFVSIARCTFPWLAPSSPPPPFPLSAPPPMPCLLDSISPRVIPQIELSCCRPHLFGFMI